MDTNKGAAVLEQTEIITSSDYRILKWITNPKGPFSYQKRDQDVIVIPVLGDGSCLLHSIVKAYHVPYIQGFTLHRDKNAGKIIKKPFDRRKFILSLRRDLSKELGSKVNSKDPESKIWYNTLSKGVLEEIHSTKVDPKKQSKIHKNAIDITKEFTLEGMKKTLNSNAFLDHKFFEFFSKVLEKDIYVLNSITKDVYIFGDDVDEIYQDRDSVVILWSSNHFETIAIKNENDEIESLFNSDHDFIKAIKHRIGKTNDSS